MFSLCYISPGQQTYRAEEEEDFVPGCYQSSPTPPDSSPGHLEMSLQGATGMLQGWDPYPGPWDGCRGFIPKLHPFYGAQDTSDAHLGLCSLRNVTPHREIGIIPTSPGAE